MRISQLSIASVALLVLLTTGCGPNPADTAGNSSGNAIPDSLTMDAPPPMTVEDHAHPSEGPHHGTLVELGNEEFHAELVHDDKSVTIFVLDSAAKNAVPVDASEVVINVLHDGKPEQFKLSAVPEESDPSGKSSRFVANDAELASHLDDDAAAPKLSITINGKPYRGVISHKHEHDHAH